MKRSFIAIFGTWAFVCSSSTAWSFEPGWYASEKNDMIFKTIAKADRSLEFTGENEIDIGIGETCILSRYNPTAGRNQITFKVNEIESFLKHEKHKELLVLWFDKNITNDKVKKSKTFFTIKPFLDRLGFHRILVLGSHGAGVFVIRDLHYPIVASKHSLQQPDRYLDFSDGLDRIKIGIMREKQERIYGDTKKEQTTLLIERKFSRGELSDFLKNEKHKEYLQVKLPKDRQFKGVVLNFLKTLGYQHMQFNLVRHE